MKPEKGPKGTTHTLLIFAGEGTFEGIITNYTEKLRLQLLLYVFFVFMHLHIFNATKPVFLRKTPKCMYLPASSPTAMRS